MQNQQLLSTKEELLKPKIDVVFHALFRRANNTLLEAMLTAILDRNVKITSNLDRHLDIAHADEKLEIMDLRVEFEDKSICNIEIQLKEHKYENERFLYYLADTYSSQLNRGEEYKQIHKTIEIVIINHEIEVLKGLDNLNIKWQMRDNKTGKRLLTDKFELVIIELPKAKRIYAKKQQDKASQWIWMMFLDNPNSKEVAEITEKNKDIKKAAGELKQVSGDYELRRIAMLREKYIKDEKAALEFATEKGFKHGLNQGLKQGAIQGSKQKQIDIAKNMLQLNIEIEKIEKATGLSKEQILDLK